MKKVVSSGLVSAFVLAAGSVAAQQSGGFDPAALAREALAQPFVGISSDGTPQTGLYPIEKTGVSAAPVIDAARDFLQTLNADQRQQLRFPVDDPEWRNWANIHRFPRQGLGLAEIDSGQRDKAYALLRASLSAKGYQTARDIMRLNYHLAELVENFADYGEHLYWLIVFGEPSAGEPWGWQIEGHHLIVNYFVLGDQIVMTPTFMGSEPVTAGSGQYAGVTILEPEQTLGLDFMQTLSPEQQRVALLGAKQGRSENLAEMFKDNITVPFEGLGADRLDAAQRERLLTLIGLYVGNLDDAHAAVRLDQVRAHLDQTYFAWKGATDADAVFYYRIHSPVILIEFDHQGPIALDGPRGVPTRRHIHTVVRTPNGNDYGKDLLRQHYRAFHHDTGHGRPIAIRAMR